jgi:16S rRNA processing protein RimM
MVESSSEKTAAAAGPDDLVFVGIVAAPHGVQGELRMNPLMEKPETLAKLPAVLLRFSDGREEKRRVTSSRKNNKQVLVTIAGVPDRTAAEGLRGAQIFIRRDQLPELPPDTYYEDQLKGLQVVTETGQDLGIIERVLFLPANDVYETAVALIPAVDEFIVSVDLSAGRVTVRDVPGLRKDE